MMELRNTALQTLKHTKPKHHWSYYKELRKLVTSAKKREKKAYLSHVLGGKHFPVFWKIVRNNERIEIPDILSHFNQINTFLYTVTCRDYGNFYNGKGLEFVYFTYDSIYNTYYQLLNENRHTYKLLQPIPKYKNQTYFSYLRNICILPAILKILEKCKKKQLRKFYVSNNLLPTVQ